MRNRILAVTLATALLSVLPAPADAATTYTLISLDVTLTNQTAAGATATATTAARSSATTYVPNFGVCARDQSGRNRDFWKRPATIAPEGTAALPDTKVLANGTYTAFSCVYDGVWRQVGAAKTFTVPAPTSPPPTSPNPTPAPSPATPTPNPTPAAAPPAGPVGVTGSWASTFTDEFDGASVDRTKWNPAYCKTMNNVTIDPANTTVADGVATLRLAAGKGAMLTTSSVDGCGGTSSNYLFPVGGYAEARAYFPTTNAGACANWPAWWVSGPSWPAAGEHDIAEVLEGQLTGNYHSPVGGPRTYSGGSKWCGGWHVYGIHRLAASADLYWDGIKVASYPTSDNGGGESLILNIGVHSSNTDTSRPLVVDWVRAWGPA